ncbi:hypothetical protein [Anoxybacillus kestanbolensis]|jgi:hypothetical protein|uniref:hypothetical protein n=1 Tax=Anoxybacillus kestanbolensis TaxID=227476 RepID=UPI001CF79886|nr:hypothetical protein [Anoxybacillus kestanbolensis]
MSRGIIDNKQTGLVGDVLKEYITKGSKLSVAAAHFTLYAFVELKKELSQLEEFRFIFTEPAFVHGIKLFINPKYDQYPAIYQRRIPL